MAFTGQTYRLGLSDSFNGSDDLTVIPPGQLANQSRNINTHNGGAEKRGGTAIVGSAISGTPQALGIGQMTASSGTSYLYFIGSDGKIYRDGTSVATGLSTTAFRALTAYPGKMFICSGADPVKVDTGAAIATIGTPSADWSGTNQPKQIVLHARNASVRGFGFGVPNKPNLVYYSSLNILEEYQGGTSGTINVNVQDGNGITGAVSIDDNLLMVGKEESFWLDDSATSTASWGVYKTAWAGGAYSNRLLLKARNNVFAMMEDGDIYRIDRAEQLRDYDRASITRPWFIHTWIKNNVDLTKISQFHMAYDPQIDALKIFVVLNGNSQVTCALVYYLPNNLIPEGKWGPPHDCTDNPAASGYNASVAASVLVSAGEKRLYTGDYAGRIWSLEKSSKSDNSAAYKGTIDTPQLDMENPRSTKLFLETRLDYTSRGAYDIEFKPIVDDQDQAISTITLASSGVGLGSFALDTDGLGVVGLNEAKATVGQEGKWLRAQISNDGAGEDFFISKLLIDFNDFGGLP